MPNQTRLVSPGAKAGTVRTTDGRTLRVPANWQLLRPGDAALTRRVKSAGPTWTMQEARGHKIFSRGVWAPTERIESIRTALEAERSTPSYAKRRASETARRARKEGVYVEDFRSAVVEFLDFALVYASLADEIAKAVASHATPVGSGTVARTERIPIERRAESAVIAWMRHQTTAYDHLSIPRIKGKRREVRRMLAEESRRLLETYRRGEPVDEDACPLRRAVQTA